MQDIGSYIELEFPKGRELFQDISEQDKIRLNHGRAAIYHALRCYGIKKVWLARYQCFVVRDFLWSKGIEVDYYEIDKDFKPLLESNEPDTAIVLNNYFGLLGDKHFEPLLKKYHNVIIDNAQAMFYPPKMDVLNIYSPRKFLSVPDGAYVIGKNVNRFSYEQDVSSDTAQFLLMRYEYGFNGNGYANKRANDERINTSDIKLMSKLTQILLDSFDYENILERRRANFAYARSQFDSINMLNLDELLGENVEPMGYPLMVDFAEIMPEFHKHHIYQKNYWEHILHETEPDSVEYKLSKYFTLVCTDQRYGKEEIDFQRDIIFRLKEESERKSK